MFLFESKNLKNRLINSAKKFIKSDKKESSAYITIGNFLDGYINEDIISFIKLIKCVGEEYTQEELDDLCWDEEENIILPKEKVKLELDSARLNINFKLDEFIELVNEAHKVKIDEDGIIVSDRYSVIRIQRFYKIRTEKLNILSTQFSIKDKNISVNIKAENKLYFLKLYFDENFDEWNPIQTYQELFVVLECNKYFFNKNNIKVIYNSYSYQLFIENDIKLHIIPQYDIKKINDELDRIQQFEEYGECEKESGVKSEPNFKIDTKLFSSEVNELVVRFNEIETVFDYDYMILEYFKILEYISDTVSRKQLIKSMTYKLNNHKPKEYDANYVMELEKIFTETQQKYMKAKNKIQLVIEECCDYKKIQEHIPNYIQLYIEEKLSKNTKKYNEKNLVVDNIAKGITYTRHSIAHSRVNYSNNKYQCPIEQRGKMVKLLREICIQAINWYSNCDKNIRVCKKS